MLKRSESAFKAGWALSTEYCEVCGRALRGGSHEVFVEGATVRVCKECYERISGGKRVQGAARPPSPPARVRASVRRKEQVEYELVENFGEVVRQAREKMGWTVQALAARLMESEGVVRRIEQGRLRPTIELARKLERILKVKLLQPVAEEAPPPHVEKAQDLTLGDIAHVRTRKRG